MDDRHRIASTWIGAFVLVLALAARADAACGDGVVDPGEGCDQGTLNGHSCCEANCQPKSCDDGETCTTDTCVYNANRHRGDCRHDSVAANTPCASDGIPCTHDACNSQGSCRHTVVAVPEQDCDGDPCTVPTCTSSGQCLETGQRCDDGDLCTSDVCNPTTGACSWTPIGDGGTCGTVACHQPSRCFGGVCVPGAPVTCPNDGNACTDDVCVPGQGCTHQALDGAACPDDGNQCTDDVCEGATCKHRPVENRTCSMGVCQPLGTCIRVNSTTAECAFPVGTVRCNPPDPCSTDGTTCDDGQPCSPASSCTSGVCSGTCPEPCPTDAFDCDDYNLCTASSQCLDGACVGGDCQVGMPDPYNCGLRCDLRDGVCGLVGQ